MIISIHINDEDINRLAGKDGPRLVVNEFRKSPEWFVSAADHVEVKGAFGQYMEVGNSAEDVACG